MAWLAAEKMGSNRANLGSDPSPATRELCDLGQATVPLRLGFLSWKAEVNTEPGLSQEGGLNVRAECGASHRKGLVSVSHSFHPPPALPPVLHLRLSCGGHTGVQRSCFGV